MAGDWIKMRTNLDTDPAVVRIASGLKTDRFAIVGRLHKIWSWANEHLTDGQDVPVDADFLDSLVSTPGFSAELRRVGWLSGRDGCLVFPGFQRHNGSTAKARALDTARKKGVRDLSEKCPDQNRTETGPEKRREEKSINEIPKGISSPEQSSEPAGDSGYVFALQAGTWHLPAKGLAEYVATYRFDVGQELRKAAQWLRDNKDRRPRTGTGVKKFLTRWLNRVDGNSKTAEVVYKPPSERKRDPKQVFEFERSKLVKRARSENWDDDRLRAAIERIRPKEVADAL